MTEEMKRVVITQWPGKVDIALYDGQMVASNELSVQEIRLLRFPRAQVGLHVKFLTDAVGWPVRQAGAITELVCSMIEPEGDAVCEPASEGTLEGRYGE